MLEYPFFHPRPYALFLEFLDARGIAHVRREEGEERTVRLPEDLPGAAAEAVEAYYDELLDLTQALVSEPDSPDEYAGASIRIALGDGRETVAVVEPALLDKALRCLSARELNALVAAVAQAVAHPDARSVCQRHRDAGAGRG